MKKPAPPTIGLIAQIFVIDRQNRVLILHRALHDAYPGWWDVPGGSVDPGENPTRAARREVFEETGLRLGEMTLFDSDSHLDAKKNRQYVRLLYHAKYAGGAIRVNPREHSEFRWVTRNQPGKIKLVPSVRKRFQQREFLDGALRLNSKKSQPQKRP